MSDEISDCVLVELAQKGDNDAYDQLMLRHQETIARQMRRFSRELSVIEELTQTVFVRAYLSLPSYKPLSPFLHWLRLLASRVGYDYWREQYRQPTLVEYSSLREQQVLACSDDVQAREAEEVLEHILATLSPEEKQILYMVYKDEMSMAEVAECMGWSVAMTKMRSYRARLKLRKILKREGSEFHI